MMDEMPNSLTFYKVTFHGEAYIWRSEGSKANFKGIKRCFE